jgi:hypothetical protein
MIHAAVGSETGYSSPQPLSDESNENMNIKKPVPNKYKTEICKNWELEGF